MKKNLAQKGAFGHCKTKRLRLWGSTSPYVQGQTASVVESEPYQPDMQHEPFWRRSAKSIKSKVRGASV